MTRISIWSLCRGSFLRLAVSSIIISFAQYSVAQNYGSATSAMESDVRRLPLNNKSLSMQQPLDHRRLTPLHCASVGKGAPTSRSDVDARNCVEFAGGDATLCWDLTASGGYVDFHLTVKNWESEGWFAWGLSESGGMKGADYVVYTQDPSSLALQIEDRFSENIALPVLDARQDVALLVGEIHSGTLYSVVRRPIASCDDEDVRFNLQANNFIWAYGSRSSNGELSKHAANARGALSDIHIARKQEARAEPGITFHEFKMPNVEVRKTNSKNSYVCKEFSIPVELLEKKGHVVFAEAVLDDASAHLVHHAVFNGCGNKGAGYTNGINLNCQQMSQNCLDPISGWAPGSSALSFSKDARPSLGIPVGKGFSTTFVMQMHYYNPDGEIGVHDNFGLRIGFEVSDGSRVDVGSIATGHVKFEIPPGHNRAPVHGICKGKFISDDITVIRGVNYHMHQRGVRAETRLFGPGHDELGTRLAKRAYYDYNFQMTTPFEDAEYDEQFTVIKAGTTIVTTCEYDTSSDQAPVKFGDYTQEEMCFGFLQYYPRNPNVGLGGTSTEGGFEVDFAASEAGGIETDLFADRTPYLQAMTEDLQCKATCLWDGEPERTENGVVSASPPHLTTRMSAFVMVVILPFSIIRL